MTDISQAFEHESRVTRKRDREASCAASTKKRSIIMPRKLASAPPWGFVDDLQKTSASITDQPEAYRHGQAPFLRRRPVMHTVEHRSHRGLNTRANNSHLPRRKRERAMRGFRSPGALQSFANVFLVVRNLFVLPRSKHSAPPSICIVSERSHIGRRSPEQAACPEVAFGKLT